MSQQIRRQLGAARVTDEQDLFFTVRIPASRVAVARREAIAEAVLALKGQGLEDGAVQERLHPLRGGDIIEEIIVESVENAYPMAFYCITGVPGCHEIQRDLPLILVEGD